jgi:hypothetical protein
VAHAAATYRRHRQRRSLPLSLDQF